MLTGASYYAGVLGLRFQQGSRHAPITERRIVRGTEHRDVGRLPAQSCNSVFDLVQPLECRRRQGSPHDPGAGQRIGATEQLGVVH